MCQFTEKNKEIILLKVECEKYHRKQKFRKKVITLFSDKPSSFEKINFIELDRVITSDRKMAYVFNDYFSNIVADLGLKIPVALNHQNAKSEDPIVNSISNEQNHHIIILKQLCKNFVKIISVSKLQF